VYDLIINNNYYFRTKHYLFSVSFSAFGLLL